MLTFDGDGLGNAITASVTEATKNEIAERFRSIRHPKTGEFPTVIAYGRELSDLSLKIEGSKELIQHIHNKLPEQELTGVKFVERRKALSPKVFLSFGWDDRDLAAEIAKELMGKGIDTWWAEWEIKSGDSLRQKIDEGLGVCTHFIVLLSPTSIEKPWVNQEMDAGLMRMLEKKCKFIPLRFNLSHQKLPPLLAGRLSPEVSEELDLTQLINDIYEISSKPPLGKSPVDDSLPDTGFSVAATTIAKVFCKNSEIGTSNDPMLDMEDLIEKAQLTKEDTEDALYELRSFFKDDHYSVMPEDELFVEFDKVFMGWEPEQDALRITSSIINDEAFPTQVAEIATLFDWTPRRINPAINYLVNRGICRDDEFCGTHPWTQFYINEKQSGSIRRFVKSRS